ncbi:MAG: hypothetical protein AMJ70_04590 [Dehalococcoidia bacterium SG8_51_3]|nr:MAG: hypothetical protein AMJ70_04590 [Dehalococcoidia bacterium SG8_51_3]
MINVTEGAKKELERLLTTTVNWPEARLRLIDRGNGVLGMGVDIETPGDEIVEYEGKPVLVIEPRLANNQEGITLDVDETAGIVEIVIIEGARA